MVNFLDNPATQGFFAPQRFEADIADCEIVGQIPADLTGTFVQVGGQWLYPPLSKEDSPFSQDGFIASFRFKDGKADYKSRWIQTNHYRQNRAAGRQLYGNYRNPFVDDPNVRDPDKPYLRTVANTAPLFHAGKLFATKEDGLPHQIDPKTLETIGPWDFHGKYKSQTFTAHAKIDPQSGEMICYGYEATGLLSDDLFLYTVSKAGEVTRETRIKVPYVSMVHDIALTQKHIIFPVYGYVTSLERLKAGKVHWGWDSQAPTYYGIIPRDGGAKDIRWFKGPERAIVHTFNARSDGNKVILEAPIFDSNPFPFFPAVDGSPWNPEKARARIRRVTFDLNSKDDGYREEILFDMPVVDLVRIDERFTSLRNRYGYTGFADPGRPFNEARGGNIKGRVTNCYGRFDLETGKSSAYFAGDTHSLQECCFVPRPNSAEEGNGYLIGMANNYAEMRSELIIADAQNLEAGDIARVILPFRSMFQVHGKWIGADVLPLT